MKLSARSMKHWPISQHLVSRHAILASLSALAIVSCWLFVGRQGVSATQTNAPRALAEPRRLEVEDLNRHSTPLSPDESDAEFIRCQGTSGPRSALAQVTMPTGAIPHRAGYSDVPAMAGNYPAELPPFSPASSCNMVPYGQGSYLEPGRTPHVSEYRLRVDDVLEVVFRQTREETAVPYLLNVGDQIRIESVADIKLNRDLTIQPDGNVTLPLLGELRATRKTAQQIRDEIEVRYEEFYKKPGMTVTPLQTDTRLRDLINTVDSRFGSGGQRQVLRISPDGTITLTGLGSVPAQGLTLDELKLELNQRYATIVSGLEVQPVLSTRAPRYVFVLGEVREPGRYTLEGPTNVMQAISLSRGWNVGANLRQVVIFRRGPDWQLTATCIDVWDALYGNKTCPVDDIWLSDSDVLIIPKQKILVWDEYIHMVFSRGVYGVLPFQGSINLSKLSSI